jgi:hypothetical protein
MSTLPMCLAGHHDIHLLNYGLTQAEVPHDSSLIINVKELPEGERK